MVVIRAASADDYARLEEIENDADALLIERLRPDRWVPAPAGAARAGPGFVLVADVGVGSPVGFVHVVESDGISHIEQLSVLPGHGRRGYGRKLVEAAKEEVRTRGYERLTLRTYADVPWNAPFYASAGFVEEEATTPFHLALIEAEAELGLSRYGRRVQMAAHLR